MLKHWIKKTVRKIYSKTSSNNRARDLLTKIYFLKKGIFGIIKNGLPKFMQHVFKYKYSEKMINCKFGEKNSDKRILIIRREAYGAGLFSYIIGFMGYLDYADKQGMVPVIDMKNYDNIYRVDKVNSWERFFYQPQKEVTLEDAYKSKNVTLTAIVPPETCPNDSMEYFKSFELRRRYHLLYRRYICINDDVRIMYEKYRRYIIHYNQRVLGILCRGTDYTQIKPINHPVQPDSEDVINKALEITSEYKLDKIFLVTEDQKILEKFRKFVPEDMLVYLDVLRYDYKGNEYLADIKLSNKFEQIQRGKEYLVQLMLLADCNCFIAGRTSGSVGVAFMTEGFEYEYYWDLGRYG